jgi:hypothetical protein
MSVNDAMLTTIDKLIELIENENHDTSEIPRIRSRDEILNLHRAFIKTILLL